MDDQSNQALTGVRTSRFWKRMCLAGLAAFSVNFLIQYVWIAYLAPGTFSAEMPAEFHRPLFGILLLDAVLVGSFAAALVGAIGWAVLWSRYR